MIKEAIEALVASRSLSMEEAAKVMEEIMTGEATPAQFAAFVTALRIKGETVDEIAGLAGVMKSKATPVLISDSIVDTCGTGGDASGTFNISTAAAFVAAGAGVRVAKHGNRAMTSQCGSADVLEALGVKIDLGPDGVRHCLETVGIGFMFAPIFHPAMKYAAGPRREIGIRTVFNILGPLTNPAGAQAQVIGIADGSLAPKMAHVLQILGCRHALIVHGDDGLDEISLASRTLIYELSQGTIKNYYISPEDMGLSRASLDSLIGGTATENAETLHKILSGAPGHHRDVVLMNSAAALLAGEKVTGLQQGIVLAREAIDSGRAQQKLDDLVKTSQAWGK